MLQLHIIGLHITNNGLTRTRDALQQQVKTHFRILFMAVSTRTDERALICLQSNQELEHFQFGTQSPRVPSDDVTQLDSPTSIDTVSDDTATGIAAIDAHYLLPAPVR